MKIHLYNHSYSRIFHICNELLSFMNYDKQNLDKSLGIIQAYKSTSLERIFDLKFTIEKDTLIITIIPGLITSDFRTINYDGNTAEFFTETLYKYLNNAELNSFRLRDEDYAEAIAV